MDQIFGLFFLGSACIHCFCSSLVISWIGLDSLFPSFLRYFFDRLGFTVFALSSLFLGSTGIHCFRPSLVISWIDWDSLFSPFPRYFLDRLFSPFPRYFLDRLGFTVSVLPSLFLGSTGIHCFRPSLVISWIDLDSLFSPFPRYFLDRLGFTVFALSSLLLRSTGIHCFRPSLVISWIDLDSLFSPFPRYFLDRLGFTVFALPSLFLGSTVFALPSLFLGSTWIHCFCPSLVISCIDWDSLFSPFLRFSVSVRIDYLLFFVFFFHELAWINFFFLNPISFLWIHLNSLYPCSLHFCMDRLSFTLFALFSFFFQISLDSVFFPS